MCLRAMEWQGVWSPIFSWLIGAARGTNASHVEKSEPANKAQSRVPVRELISMSKKPISPLAVVTIENVVVSFDAGAHELHKLVLFVVSSGRITG